MTPAAGKIFCIVGALAAFPQRLAAREVERQSGQLRRSVSRQTTHVVFGRGLLARKREAEIEVRFDQARTAGRRLISENGFLRTLGLREAPAAAIARASLLDQSKLSEHDLDLLSLFDAFEHDSEPYSFQDLILAKKYARLIADGANWGAIARSVHRKPDAVTSLTSLSLEAERRDAIYARLGEHLSELDGQMLLPITQTDDAELEELFEQAEDAEADERFDEAAALYERCLSIDPKDPDAAFNRANCLARMDRQEDARRSFLHALKLDPNFVEAWFNLANLVKAQGRVETARKHLQKAIALDAHYADPIYNLATLEFEAGRLAEARRWWARYVEVDAGSEWARSAEKGMQYIDMQLARRNAG